MIKTVSHVYEPTLIFCRDLSQVSLVRFFGPYKSRITEISLYSANLVSVFPWMLRSVRNEHSGFHSPNDCYPVCSVVTLRKQLSFLYPRGLFHCHDNRSDTLLQALEGMQAIVSQFSWLVTVTFFVAPSVQRKLSMGKSFWNCTCVGCRECRRYIFPKLRCALG